MVPILTGNSEHVAHTQRKMGLFREKPFVTALYFIKCLKQVKYLRLLLVPLGNRMFSGHSIFTDNNHLVKSYDT